MPEPFKNFFSRNLIDQMGDHFGRASKSFDRKRFVKLAAANLEELELKERSNQIKDALHATLPDDFNKAASIMVKSLHPENDVDLSDISMDEQGIRGWAVMPMTEYVAEAGLDEFDLGMEVQKELTKRFSAEFGIRYFLLEDQARALGIMAGWADDDNYHVRRLVSEGTRPRLPWGIRLHQFIEDPEPVIPLLEKLRDDPKEYVRRSVANNLNDIAKDHPARVAQIARDWMAGAGTQRQKLVRHACRTLVKDGYGPALEALGFGSPEVELGYFRLSSETLDLGQSIELDLEFSSTAKTSQNLVLDYAVHHQKSNGSTSPKVFKWKTLELKAGQTFTGQKKHGIKPITTRTYYPGRHEIQVLVNGESLARAGFDLRIA